MSTRLCNVMRLALDSSRLGILRGVIVSSRLASVSPAACSSEDTAISECQQHLVVVDWSVGRSTVIPLMLLGLCMH